ncbi:MAG: hypothetical protein RIQ71_1113 [Verrucomicrobiota bacterium]|jgi:hypothetical protein
MNNPHLIARLTGIQQALMAQHLGGRGMPNAAIGSERETFLREFLGKVFPSHYRFTSGAITDSTGSISGQIDIAVEYPFLPSFPMPASGERLLLAESVAAVIEVKSDLSGQWGQVQSTIRALRPLRRKWKGTVGLIGGGIRFGSGSETPVPTIAVGYTGHTTIDGLKQRLDTTIEQERPDAAFVVQSGCFVGFGMKASGPLGIYALCIAVSQLTAAIAAAESDPLMYVAQDKRDA